MKAIHTVSSIHEEASGISYTAPRLARSLIASGCAAELFTLGEAGTSRDHGLTIEHYEADAVFPRLLRKLGRSRTMRRALLTRHADIFHSHGLWMMPNVYPAEAARLAGKPFVLSPRGMLGPEALRFSALAKKSFGTLWQESAFAAVSCLHATAESEFDDIRAFGLTHPVAIIPNGIDLPNRDDLEAYDRPIGRLGSTSPFILSLGRVHPKKGLDRLIAAFALISDEFPKWHLRIVGPDEGGHSELLHRLISAKNLTSRISIEPAVYGFEKFRLLREAQIFVLATLNENFGMTVAESLAVQTPVISTKGGPWAGLVVHGCGWWIDHGPDAMAVALRKAMAMPPSELRAMGSQGREWMQRDFGWNGIGAKMAGVYEWLVVGSPQPRWVKS